MTRRNIPTLIPEVQELVDTCTVYEGKEVFGEIKVWVIKWPEPRNTSPYREWDDWDTIEAESELD